jgi:DNA-binding IclR family transcriptional regulator
MTGADGRLHPADLDALAERVAERVAELLDQDPPGLVDAATVARVLGVSRETVYDHADRLGARRLGSGARPRLRFDLERALAAWAQRPSRQPELAAPPQRRRRRRSTETTAAGVPLLPIHGGEGPS